MTGILVEINTITYGDKKEKTLHLAVVQMGTFEQSIIITPARAEELKGQVEQEFNMTLKNTTMYTKTGEPRNTLSLGLGSKVK
jgi:hypothetical protein